MSKSHRGTGIRKEPNHGRGICGRCGKSQIKVLYEQEIDGKKVKICKYCKNALKNEAQKAAKIAKASAPKEEAPAEAPAEEAQA